jgi:hypothetical protein
MGLGKGKGSGQEQPSCSAHRNNKWPDHCTRPGQHLAGSRARLLAPNPLSAHTPCIPIPAPHSPLHSRRAHLF